MTLHWSSLREAWTTMPPLHMGWAAVSLSLYIISVFITGARWSGFLRALGSPVGTVQASLATLGGIAAGNITPSRLGADPCRVSLIRFSAPVTWAQVSLAAGWDRLSEVPPIAVLVLISLAGVRHMNAGWQKPVWFVLGVVAAGLAIVGLRHLRASGADARRWLSALQLDRIRPSVFLAAVGYSTAIWLQDIIRLWCDGLALGVHLTLSQLAVLAVSAILGGLVPTVGGLVVVEGGLIAALLAFGVDVKVAVAITFVERAVSYGFSTIFGGLIIATMGGRSVWRVALRRSSGSAESDTAPQQS